MVARRLWTAIVGRSASVNRCSGGGGGGGGVGRLGRRRAVAGGEYFPLLPRPPPNIVVEKDFGA